MLDNAFAIGLVGKTHVVTRRSASSFDATGDFVEGASSQISISGSLQPVTGRMIEKMPEGLRDKASAVMYTASVLNSARDGNAGDRISFGSDTYEVMGIIDWSDPVGGHYAYALERILV